jgi:RimJ/RimL family protein N-acetyltransferase
VTDVRLAPAGPADIPYITALEGRADYARFMRVESEAEHLRRMRDRDFRYLLIEAGDGTIVGFIVIEGLALGAGALRLRRIVVESPGGGVGCSAMQALCAHVFGELGAERFWLHVFEDNLRARHVYERFGFRATGRTRVTDRRDGTTMALLEMELWAGEYRDASAG